jgi:hypothetical protein
MTTLYAIEDELAALDALLTEVGGDVTDPLAAEAITRWMTEYNWLEATKVDGYARYIRTYEARAEARRGEARRVADGARADDNRVIRLKELVRQAMEVRGVRRLEGQVHALALQRNGGRPPIEVLVPVEELPLIYRRVTVEPDREALRHGIEAGDVPPSLARLGDLGDSIRVR